MADDVTTDTELDEEEDEKFQTNAEAAESLAKSLKIPEIDFNDPNRESLSPRGSRDGKVFTNGFKIPGFSGMSDLPGKVCVDCGFSAMKFSSSCPKCGGELTSEE